MSTDTAPHARGRGGLLGDDAATRGAILAALVAVFVGALDLTVIASILPRIVTDLQINTADIDRYVWIVNGYLLAYIVAIPIVGRLSDLVGRRRMFLIALALFIIGSAWCAGADSLWSLVAARAVQGIGGGALLPITMALVGDLLPPQRRAGALGLVGAVDTLGWVLGPLWGALIVGLVATDAPWRWVFAINIPLALIALFAVRRQPGVTREKVSSDWMRHLDLIGTALLALMLVALNLGLSAGGEIGGATNGGRALGGTRNPLAEWTLPLLGIAAVSAVLLVLHERRTPYPLLPPHLFRRPAFSAAIAANFVVGAALIVAMVDVPVVVTLLVDENRVSVVTALMMAPFTLLMAALSFGGGMWAGRSGERRVALIGLVLVFMGYAVLWWGLRDGHYLGLLPGLMLAGAGFGLVVAPIGAAAINAADAEDRGVAAALSLVFRLLGMTVSISGLTALGVYRLQGLVNLTEDVVQLPGESTAEFFARQTEFLYETIIPLTLQVVRETFLIAGVLALIAVVPILAMTRMRRTESSV